MENDKLNDLYIFIAFQDKNNELTNRVFSDEKEATRWLFEKWLKFGSLQTSSVFGFGLCRLKLHGAKVMKVETAIYLDFEDLEKPDNEWRPARKPVEKLLRSVWKKTLKQLS